jgi:hypothetical protein
MKKYLLLVFMAIMVVSCGEKVDTEKNLVDTLSGMPGGHPPVSGMDALSELSDDAPSFDPSNPVLELSDITLTAPDNWLREKPTSAMRIVQYSLKNSPESKIVGFFFGQQDLLRENIDRWKNEFVELKSAEEETMAGDKVTMVVLEGVYNVKPFPMAEEFTATPDYMVLAAIVQSNEGPYYFKVFAPSKILKPEIANFKKFLNSYKIKS